MASALLGMAAWRRSLREQNDALGFKSNQSAISRTVYQGALIQDAETATQNLCTFHVPGTYEVPGIYYLPGICRCVTPSSLSAAIQQLHGVYIICFAQQFQVDVTTHLSPCSRCSPCRTGWRPTFRSRRGPRPCRGRSRTGPRLTRHRCRSRTD